MVGVELFKKVECELKKFVCEICGFVDGFEVGGEINVGLFEGVVFVDVVGILKGCGYVGVMKWYNFVG